MPDLDIVERNLPREWRRPYRLLKGGHETSVVCDAIVQALTAHLRREGGAPELFLFEAALVRPRALGLATRPSLPEVCREIELRFDNRPVAQLMGRATLRLHARISSGRALPSREALAVEFLRQVIDNQFFGRFEPTLVGNRRRFESLAARDRYRENCLRQIEVRLRSVAGQLRRDLSAGSLRAPGRQRTRKMTTAELLSTPIA